MVVVLVLEPEGDWQVFDLASALHNQVRTLSSGAYLVDIDVHAIEVCSSLEFDMVAPDALKAHVLGVALEVVNAGSSQVGDVLLILSTLVDHLVNNIVSHLQVFGLILEQKQCN